MLNPKKLNDASVETKRIYDDQLSLNKNIQACDCFISMVKNLMNIDQRERSKV